MVSTLHLLPCISSMYVKENQDRKKSATIRKLIIISMTQFKLNYHLGYLGIYNQPAFTCSNSLIETTQ